MVSKDIYDKEKVSKDDSLLEIAIKTLRKKRTPQNIYKIVDDVMSQKGFKRDEVESNAPQFILDFMLSGYFVYCGENTWDLKERQPLSVLDKEGGDYDFFEDDEDVKKNELSDDQYGLDLVNKASSATDDVDDEDDEDEEVIDEDDLTNEFDNPTELLLEDEELDEENIETVFKKGSKNPTKLKLSDEDDDDEEEEDEDY